MGRTMDCSIQEEPIMEPTYKILIIPLPVDLKDTLYYHLTQTSSTIDPGYFDNFPRMILEAAKDPVLGLVEIYAELTDMLGEGLLTVFTDECGLPEEQLFKRAGSEIGLILDHLIEVFKGEPDEINLYTHAIYHPDAIILTNIRELKEADIF